MTRNQAEIVYREGLCLKHGIVSDEVSDFAHSYVTQPSYGNMRGESSSVRLNSGTDQYRFDFLLQMHERLAFVYTHPKHSRVFSGGKNAYPLKGKLERFGVDFIQSLANVAKNVSVNFANKSKSQVNLIRPKPSRASHTRAYPLKMLERRFRQWYGYK